MRPTILLALALSACADFDTDLDAPAADALQGFDLDGYDYTVTPPDHLEAALARADNTPADNPITNAGARLGRVLFWDTELSQNRSVACASCHVAELGFSDDVPLSEGFDGGDTGRKSMPLVNVRYYRPGRMFWDERAATLEEQVLLPIQDEVEMGLTLDALEVRVQEAPYYAPLFEDAFGDDTVDADRISRALSQFVRSMESFDSPFDAGVAATGDPRAPFPGFTAQENRGKDIFFGDVPGGDGRPLCDACHLPTPPPGGGPPPPQNPGILFMPGPRVNGLPDPDDAGLAERTGLPGDVGRFKSPSLRNVALRGPFMHDGRFETLEEVVGFYDRGIQGVANLDPVLREADGSPRRLGLSPEDRDALVAFLRTLTDPGPAEDPRFLDPFPE